MRSLFVTLLLLAVLVPASEISSAAPAASTPWRIAGNLSEVCTCTVPCNCNFGEGPFPRSYCWAIFSLSIDKGHHGSVKLDGLRLAAGVGGKGIVYYIDDRATAQQAAALKAIGTQIWARTHKAIGVNDPTAPTSPGMRLLGFKTAKITHELRPLGNRVVIGSQGGFETDYLIGIDGKTPIMVENNWSWNIRNGIKGKTKRMHYKDGFGNEFDERATNANQGKFDWSDKTPIYFR